MSDANGGVVVLAIIVFFIVVVSAYLAFNVNYTKAFRMKNKIISYYDEYNGNCNSNCLKQIKDYAKSIGYSPDNKLKCSSSAKDGGSGTAWRKVDGYFCEGKVVKKGKKSSNNVNNKGINIESGEYVNEQFYFKIETKINIKIPIVDNILGIKAFRITGDTKVYEK